MDVPRDSAAYNGDIPCSQHVARSLTFSTASLAVGVHTPALQIMFWVGADEISTDA